MKTNPTIIISRTDNMGDVMLTLPLASYLKKQYPQSHIIFLGRDYVAAAVAACPSVDQFLSWNKLKKLPTDQAITFLHDVKADIMLHVAPNKKIAQLAKQAHIKLRIGTNRRWYHWLYCNKLINFSRKNSNLHEAQLNFKLLTPLKLNTAFSLTEIANLQNMTRSIEKTPKITLVLDPTRFNLVIHPLTNGNTKEWPLDQFARLIEQLPVEKFNIIITGTAAEKPKLNLLLQMDRPIHDTVGKLNLDEFINLLTHADGIVVGSTGPLHIAAALNIHALGLFPLEKGKSPERWAPIGAQAEYIVANECDACRNQKNETCVCMQNITPKQVTAIIQRWAMPE